MITPEEFPYIKSLYVNDCYAYKDFSIELHNYKPFSHLILTGKNGSGKSTILRNIDNYISAWLSTALPLTNHTLLESHIKQIKETIEYIKRTGHSVDQINLWEQELLKYDKINVFSLVESEQFWSKYRITALYSFFKAKRTSITAPVDNPSKETEFTENLNSPGSTEFFINKFKQYLVNRKVEQAFSQIENKSEQVKSVGLLFISLRETFKKLFDEPLVSIDFDRTNYEFYLSFKNGRRLTFDTLSEGFSALISILMDLFVRVDLIRKQVNDYSYNPCGIVLIDEPETHLHLQLQEQVLPLLTSLFPNVQFIVATHSPAVIASIKQATIFDLTTKESRTSEETAGRSYSDLMRGHFGLNNEYSGIADELFRKVDQMLKEYKHQPEELKIRLQQFFMDNEAYFSPSFRVELESMILENA